MLRGARPAQQLSADFARWIYRRMILSHTHKEVFAAFEKIVFEKGKNQRFNHWIFKQADRLEVLEATAAAIIRSRALGQISAMGEGVIQELVGAFPGL
jgi:hypothetical protein